MNGEPAGPGPDVIILLQGTVLHGWAGVNEQYCSIYNADGRDTVYVPWHRIKAVEIRHRPEEHG